MTEIIFLLGAVGIVILLMLFIPSKQNKVWQTVHREQEEKTELPSTKKSMVVDWLKYISFHTFIKEAKKVGWNITIVAPLLLYGMGALGGLFGWVLGSKLATVVGVIVGLALPWVWLRGQKLKYEDRLEQQVENMIQAIASSYSLNPNIVYALNKAQEDVEQPLKGMLERAEYEYRSGRPLRDIFREMSETLDVAGFDMFSTVMEHIERAGGDSTDLIKNTARAVQQRRREKAELRTELADTRQEHKFLVGIALVVLLFFRFAQPELYLEFANHVLGDVVIGATMIYVAWSIFQVEKLTEV